MNLGQKRSVTERLKVFCLMMLLSPMALVTSQITAKKNIVLIMADDFNYWNSLQGYYMQPNKITPNLDKLSKRGVLFSDAQAAAPVCNPSRSAMWSGYRPSTTGIIGNESGYIRTTAPFQNIVTMNQYFMDNGYWVYGSGKLYHGNFTPGQGDATTDIEHWSASNPNKNGCNGGTYLNYKSIDSPEYSWSVNQATMSTSNCGDFDIATEAARVISTYSASVNKDKPFFITCGLAKPHLPFNVPKQFYDLFNDADIVRPAAYKVGDLSDTNEGTYQIFTELETGNKWVEAIHMYIAALALSDYNAGIIIDAVDNTTLKDNTIIVFMGDHGWHLGEKNRYGKASPWDLSNKTTLIIYDPSYANTSTTPNICKKVVSLQDIYPTLVELSGLPIKTNIEGNSIAALIENPNKADWDKPVAVSRVFDRLRTNKWSYVDSDGDASTTSSKDMLYDIENDPYEFDNLLNVNQTKLPVATVNAIRARLVFQLDSIKNIGTSIKSKLLTNYTFVPKTLTIPGVIQAEDYDEGGYAQAYYDADKVNSGGKYRTADGTDIYITDDVSGSFHLGALAAGDWCNYTVKNYLTGDYTIKLRVRNTGTTPAVVQIFNRELLLCEVSVPVSATWRTVTSPQIHLADQYSTRLQLKVKSGSGLQLNFMRFTMVSTLKNTAITADVSRKCLVNSTVTDDVLYLDLQSTDNITTVSIYDVNGKLVSTSKVPGEQMVAFTAPTHLKSGIYFLRIEDDFVASVEKFIVK